MLGIDDKVVGTSLYQSVEKYLSRTEKCAPDTLEATFPPCCIKGFKTGEVFTLGSSARCDLLLGDLLLFEEEEEEEEELETGGGGGGGVERILSAVKVYKRSTSSSERRSEDGCKPSNELSGSTR